MFQEWQLDQQKPPGQARTIRSLWLVLAASSSASDWSRPVVMALAQWVSQSPPGLCMIQILDQKVPFTGKTLIWVQYTDFKPTKKWAKNECFMVKRWLSSQVSCVYHDKNTFSKNDCLNNWLFIFTRHLVVNCCSEASCNDWSSAIIYGCRGCDHHSLSLSWGNQKQFSYESSRKNTN